MRTSGLRMWFAAIMLAIIFSIALPVNAAQDVPQALKQIIGLYEGGGERFLLRENGGRVELVYDLSDNGTPFSVCAVYPLQAMTGDEYRLEAPNPLGRVSGGIRIMRDHEGFGTVCRIGTNVYHRRFFDPEKGLIYQIKPQASLEKLREIAAAASPPREQGDFLLPDLVNVVSLDSTIKVDIRYATNDNFMGIALYDRARAYLQRSAAEALVRAHTKLAGHGYGIIIHDAYRPWAVTKMFWDATPDAQKIFVADPTKGSRHNRGGAVDISLYDLATGQPVAMISDFDEFSLRAHPSYPGGTALERWRRDLLRIYMEAEGFTVYDEEWWHFDYKDWRKYPVMNSSFAELDAAGSQ